MSYPTKHYLLLIIKIGGVLFVWLCLLALFHQLLHQYPQVASSLLDTPAKQFVTAVVVLSTLIYLLIWSLPNLRRPGWRGALVIVVWAVLIVIGHGVTHIGESSAQALSHKLQEMMGWQGFLLLACTYSLFLAMPFVAGVEIGLLIMAIFGVPGVLVTYCGTQIGLNLAFGAGRLLPPEVLRLWLTKLNLQPQGQEVDSLLESLLQKSGWLSTLSKRLLDSRYIALAIGLNFPGNSLVGGGGGLSLLAGISRKLFYWPYFTLVTLLATLPVPLLVLFGLLNIDSIVAHSGWFHGLLGNLYELFSSLYRALFHPAHVG